MTNVGEILTALGATAGLAVLLIMALVPLLLDRPGKQERVVEVPAPRR